MKNLIQTVKNFGVRHPIAGIVMLIIFFWICYVPIHNIMRLDEGYVRISGLLDSIDDLKNSTTSTELYEAKYFAAMSAEVYRLQHVKDSKTQQPKCDLKKFLWDSNWRLLLPSDLIPKSPNEEGVDPKKKASLDGELVYGIWYRKLKTGTVQIALVFRGTHTSGDWGDWWSNARWITSHLGAGWDQYDLARTLARYAAMELVDDHNKLEGAGSPELIVAGHSLGGGLAQQAGYATESIKRVYSFNGTAVTGFFSAPNRERNKVGKRIYRIGERGEILGLFRNAMRIVYPVVEQNPKIVEATYNFGPAGIEAHSIDDLACALKDAG